MNVDRSKLREAALQLGHSEPISIEADGTIWLGIDPDRQYLSDTEQKAVEQKAKQLADEVIAARQSAFSKLAALGLSETEITALLGA